MTVKFHWSRQIIFSSIVLCAICLVVIPSIFYLCNLGSIAVYFGCMIGCFCGCANQTPLTLGISPDSIKAKMVLGSINIPLDQVVSIEKIPSSDIKLTRYLMGSLGFFGSWGAIKIPNKGKFYMYATELDNLILVKTNFYRSYIFSCTEREAFIEQVQKQIATTQK